MQEQTKRMMEQQGKVRSGGFARTAPPSNAPPEPKSPPPPPKHRGKELFDLLNFKNLELDSDRIVIVALALLLTAQDADEMLILALLYIML